MPRRTDIKKIMIIGSGPIVIGQASEFDYSGTQAVKALKEEGYDVILVNSNPATIMTDTDFADRVYIEPITLPYLEKIIETERPDALLPTVGGQTALNAALSLDRAGILKKYGVELIGAKSDAIARAEDRKLFKETMESIGVAVPKSGLAHSFDEAMQIITDIGFPVILRPSFTLGGSGGGVAYNQEEYEQLIRRALSESPNSQVLVEQSVLGWKEYELEVMRDSADNVVIIASIENVDPMGVHTGDSITVAPQQTLSDREYQNLRDQGIRIIRAIGVETGGSNIQFAVNPANGDVIVIEMNPRVSRSSALASKATGFPIAKIAAKLSVGYTLDEINNDITQKTPASFEPSLDYIVTKIPRFTFEKFPDSPNSLDTQMRSVGEAMAIGRSFPESFQKAMRSLENGLGGFGSDGNLVTFLEMKKVEREGRLDSYLRERLATPNDRRYQYLRYALDLGYSVEQLHSITFIDPWFLHQFDRMVEREKEFLAAVRMGQPELQMQRMRDFGYTAKQMAWIALTDELAPMLEELSQLPSGSGEYMKLVSKIQKLHSSKTAEMDRLRREKLPVVFKRIDTCAAEFESHTPYLYSTTEKECEADVSNRKKVMILGGGPNRIGQGIEFDYCCCHASFALQDLGIESIMVNSNPETVSTDYDTSDRLYFEPLTEEDILNIYDKESENGELLGAIFQFGGQTPLRLSEALEKRGVPVLGTSSESIARAEDRKLFNDMIAHLQLRQPDGRMASSMEQALTSAEELGFPVLVRPSFVLGGRAMMIVHTQEQLIRYMESATEVSEERPVLIDKFLEHALELDVDALSDGHSVFIGGILEHIEEAGVHSGDSASILPPKSLSQSMLSEVIDATEKIALELKVKGLINIQFAIFRDQLYIIEVNPRASRTVPFVSKAIGVQLAKMATRIIAGETLDDLGLRDMIIPDKYFVKEVVLPFKKFAGTDTILGPEMKSTGEVMGIGKTPGEAFFKAQEAAGSPVPLKGNLFVSINDESKSLVLDVVKRLTSQTDYKILATRGTGKFLQDNGVPVEIVNKVHEGRPHIVDRIKSGDVHLIFNVPTDIQTRNDALDIRQAALRYNVPYFTTAQAALEAFEGILEMKDRGIEVYPFSRT